MQGELNEADIQRAESNEVVGREGGEWREGGTKWEGKREGEEKEKLGPGAFLALVSYLLSSE